MSDALFGETRTGKFYPTDIATITPSKTYTTESSFIETLDCKGLAVQGYCVCGAGANSETVFYFSSYNSISEKWDDLDNAYTTLTVVQTVSKSAIRTVQIDCEFIEKIKINKIVNTDATVGATGNVTGVNCAFTKIR